MFKGSAALFQEANRYLAGGVNSPVRAFNGVGGTPIFMARGNGAYMHDVDDNRFIDYVGSWGPLILGHNHPQVVAAIQTQLALGVSFGTPNELETALASKVVELLPSIEKIRMVSSGTEAAMSAIRLARGITGRSKILKFEGCYHGHGDSLLVKAGSGALTLGVPSSPGVPPELASLTLTASFNDLAQVAEFFRQYPEQIAAVIVEPIAGNMNCVPPITGFLDGLRTLTTQHGALLIFDEVMTGFRVHPQSAQGLYQITPDLTVLGKILGGGMPVGAFAGPARFMDQIAPTGPIYQAGTLSGNPLAMACGLATLQQVSTPGFHAALAASTKALAQGLGDVARATGIPLVVNHVTGMFGIFFSKAAKVSSYAEVVACDVAQFKRFFHGMLTRGIYFAPSAFEAGFISQAHSMQDIEATIASAHQVFREMKKHL